MTDKAMGPGAGDAKAPVEVGDVEDLSSTPKHREKEAGSSAEEESLDHLIPLIKADLNNAEKAGMPFYKA